MLLSVWQQQWWALSPWASAGRGQNGAFTPPWKLVVRTKNFQKPEVSNLIPITWFNSCNDSLFASITFTLCTRARFINLCYAVMSLHFTHVCSSACRGRLRNLLADCSTVGLYGVTITWQRIFKYLRQVPAVGVLLHVTVERRHLWAVARNAARQWLLMAVSHVVIRCVKRSMSEKEALLPTKRNFCDCRRNVEHFLCGRKEKAIGERQFALHHQQPEKDTVFIRLLAALNCKPHEMVLRC